MRTQVRFRGFDPAPTLLQHALRRIDLLVLRFASEVSSVRITVSDINGPKGGLDKQCLAAVTGPRIGKLVVGDIQEDAQGSVDSAVDRLARAVARMLERVRDRARGEWRVT